MHQYFSCPDSCAQNTFCVARNAEPQTPDALGIIREAGLAFQRLENELPPGVHRAMRQMLQSLVAVADGRSIGMFSDLIVEVTAGRVLVGPSSDDPVVYGIQRRFTVRAAQTCHRCGRKGHARQDLGGCVRCAGCAAPALLLQAIDRVLRQSSPPTCGKKRTVNVVELQPLLRPMFRMHIELHLRIAPGSTNETSREMFTGWLKLLRNLACEMRHGTAAER